MKLIVLLSSYNGEKYIGEQLDSLFEKRLAIKKENKKLAELRDTLLPKLMSGEIDVSKLN